jgi:hypothetical protein
VIDACTNLIEGSIITNDVARMSFSGFTCALHRNMSEFFDLITVQLSALRDLRFRIWKSFGRGKSTVVVARLDLSSILVDLLRTYLGRRKVRKRSMVWRYVWKDANECYSSMFRN